MDVMTERTTTTTAGSSGLNPNAPSFVPLAYRTMEEFSDQWWQLLDSSSPWLRDYWLHRSRFRDQRQQLENENKKKTLMMTMLKKENDHHEEEEEDGNYDDRVLLPDADALFHGYQPQEQEKEYRYTRDVEAWNPAAEIPIRQRNLWV